MAIPVVSRLERMIRQEKLQVHAWAERQTADRAEKIQLHDPSKTGGSDSNVSPKSLKDHRFISPSIWTACERKKPSPTGKTVCSPPTMWRGRLANCG